ncbi:MAG: GTP-binding protein [Euryarchaeota archaeon]|nr:GTP-binding protein [Euryarchaeota archaeon]
MSEIEELIKNGETGNVEFKEYLSRKIHLEKSRRQGLASQMKYRVLNGSGRAIYLLGVTDDGEIKGLTKAQLDETFEVLDLIARENGFAATEKKTISRNGNFVGKVLIEKMRLEKEHLLVGTAGHVDHGKSTLVGTLVSGELDDGAGKTRLYLDTQKHEIERGLSADLSYAVYGFDRSGGVIRLKNPLSKKEKASVVGKASKIVSFVDTVGHEPWLRTTIRGIVGQKLDYGILTIAGDEKITHITKEHLGILLAMNLPVVIAITKCDKARDLSKLEMDISDLMGIVGKVAKFIRSERDLEFLPSFWETRVVVPVIRTSAKTGEGLELLDKLLYVLPKRTSQFDRNREFLMYIDKIYSVPGTGTVVSGSVKEGVVKRGEELYIGPTSDGNFHKIKASSIEIHHFSVDSAEVGEIVGIALKGLETEVERGMIITVRRDLKSARKFEADVVVLNHPTKISKGYEPVVHLETISETVVVEPLDVDFLAAGDRGRVRMQFKYRPYYIREGQKFVFREGRSKGIGSVTKVLN